VLYPIFRYGSRCCNAHGQTEGQSPFHKNMYEFGTQVPSQHVLYVSTCTNEHVCACVIMCIHADSFIDFVQYWKYTIFILQTTQKYAIFHVSVVLNFRILVTWSVTLCGRVNRFWGSEGTAFFRNWGSVNTATQCNIPGDRNLNTKIYSRCTYKDVYLLKSSNTENIIVLQVTQTIFSTSLDNLTMPALPILIMQITDQKWTHEHILQS
jgi:hypothetical protein